MATKIINKKRYQITQVTGTKTGSMLIQNRQGFLLKMYRRRFGRLGDLFERLSALILLLHNKRNR
ncbi:MAG: hypothetical protein ABF711_02665 [Leuconostoc mesenteroides]